MTSSRLNGRSFNADNQNTQALFPNNTTAAIPYNGNGDPLSLLYLSGTNPAKYDPEDRLTSANQLLLAGYDGDGLRAWSDYGPAYSITGAPTYHLNDGDQPVTEDDYTGEDLFYTVFGAAGLEGRYRTYAGAGGGTVGIAYSAYTYDPQGNLVSA
jgi:hypothetical protein